IISNLEIQSKQNTLSNQNTQLENSQADAVSIKDILALLQTAAKNNTNIEAANDEEETALENISIDADVLLQNIETAISELNVSDDLKTQLNNIILSFESIDQSDLQDIVKYISVLSDDINIADINTENISLEEISEKILGTEVDNSSLEKAYTVLQEKISEFSNQSKDNAEVKIENTEELTPLIDDKTILIDDKSNNTKIINNNAVISNVEIISNLSALIDEAVKEADLPSNNDKLELAKDIVSAVKAAAENILYKSNDVSSGNMLENTTNEKDTIVMNTDISYEDVKQTAQLLENNTESKQPLLKIDNLAESSSEDIAESNNNMQKLFETTEATDTADTVAENINSKQSNEKLSQVTVKEAVKETVKESVKDTIKQSDTVSVKDIQKEFKTASVESAESLRGESNAKAEIKARTVNLTETGKNLQNNLNQKEVVMAQSNAGAGENFSVSQSDKGNNFNYFLKSSTDAQAKYDT
ncbi:MAG: hypothetical protein K2N11_10495, partial [Mucispirillum sp.]|nr:hypothetical protein [Mucispirillum sp.]